MISARKQLMQSLFPDGIPTLWCPPLTFFEANGQLDRARTAAHLRRIAPHTRGWLVPGSTGEGWQMQDEEISHLLDLALDVARQVKATVLIGVLRKDEDAMMTCLDQMLERLCQRAGTTDAMAALRGNRVCGFTVCPPAGRHQTQSDLKQALSRILQRELPVALYQLPQVTEIEIDPETVADLVEEFPNLVLFKDTSGHDRVAQSNVELRDLFLTRGAEGSYARWLRPAGGPYDGFLLSTANVFAPQLDRMIGYLRQGDPDRAKAEIAAVEQVVPQIFDLVRPLSVGNPFTNANKVIEQLLVHRPEADNDDTPPRLYGGGLVPREIMKQAHQCLVAADLLES
jgi:dihydrodipicolinate synthase/N-acetylneuraminate lyase